MGLDSVELVMAVEERFGIAMEDSEAARMLTPGHLIDYVLGKVGYTDHAQCLTQQAFHRLRAALMRQFGFKRSQIKPETRLVDLFPRKNRRRRINQILDDLGIAKPINLNRPDWVQASIMTLFFAGGAAIAIFLFWKPLHSPDPLVNLISVSPIMTAIGSMILVLPLSLFLTKGTCVEFGKTMQTASDISRWMVGAAPDLATASPGQWNPEQISAIIREWSLSNLAAKRITTRMPVLLRIWGWIERTSSFSIFHRPHFD